MGSLAEVPHHQSPENPGFGQKSANNAIPNVFQIVKIVVCMKGGVFIGVITGNAYGNQITLTKDIRLRKKNVEE